MSFHKKKKNIFITSVFVLAGEIVIALDRGSFEFMDVVPGKAQPQGVTLIWDLYPFTSWHRQGRPFPSEQSLFALSVVHISSK